MDQIIVTDTPSLPQQPQPQFKSPTRALEAAVIAATINAAVPIVEQHMPGTGRGAERADFIRNFVLSTAPLAQFIPHSNPFTALLLNVAIQGAYQRALNSGQVRSSTVAQPPWATPTQPAPVIVQMLTPTPIPAPGKFTGVANNTAKSATPNEPPWEESSGNASSKP